MRSGKKTLEVGWPGRLAGGRKLDALAGVVDVLPTVAAAAGVRPGSAAPLDGIDLLPVLADTRPAPERALYPDRAALVTQRWKLVGSELYDLANDPGERKNVAAANPDVLAALREQLARLRAAPEAAHDTSTSPER